MNLNQVTVFTNDLESSKEFYESLGLRIIVDSAPRYVRLECPDGDSTLSLHQTEDITENNVITLYFECADLDEEYRRMKALGFEFDFAPRDQTWLWREAQLQDPDGNAIILFAAGVNRKNPPWRIADE